MFRNDYVEFELPEGWACEAGSPDFICQSQGLLEKESIIILSAKERGPGDSLDAYYQHLAKPKLRRDKEGRALESSVLDVGRRQIGGVEWVDATHRDSEISGFKTRYLACVVDDVAIVLTYSVSEDAPPEVQAELSKMLSTVRIARKRRSD